jgi:hypothetical protein
VNSCFAWDETQAGPGVEMEEEDLKPARAGRIPWPASLPERVRAVRDDLVQSTALVAPENVARNFIGARVPEVTAILETLSTLGQAGKEAGSSTVHPGSWPIS